MNQLEAQCYDDYDDYDDYDGYDGYENIMTIKQINKTRRKIYRKIPTYLSGY